MALADILKKVFGSKSDRDMKQVKPMLDKVLAAYPGIDALSDDELRARSAALRAKILAVEKPFEDRIAEIKAELEKDIPVSEKEALATESDKLVKDEDDAIEKCPRTRPSRSRRRTSTVTWRPTAAISSISRMIRPSGRTTGSPAATKSPGTWSITTCSSSAASS